MSPIPLGFLATAGAGGAAASDYELISTTILGSTATEVIFSSIPSTYKHLQIRMSMRQSSGGELYSRLNGDTTVKYAFKKLEGNGFSVSAERWFDYDWMMLGLTNSPTGGYTAMILDIVDYANTSKFKTLRTLSGFANPSDSQNVRLQSGLWRSTSAINAIRLYPESGNISIGSRFSLYGVKG